MEATIKFKTQQRTLARLGEEAAQLAIEDGRVKDAVNNLREARRRFQQVDDWAGFNRAHNALGALTGLTAAESYNQARGASYGAICHL